MPVQTKTRSTGKPATGVDRVEAPAARVPARRQTHWRNGVLWSAAGIATGAAVSIAGYGELVAPCAGGGLAVGATVTTLGARQKTRRELEDRTLEALAPTIGAHRLDRRTVIMSHWSAGWPGVPRKIRIHYAPGILDAGMELEPKVLGTLAIRLGGRYRVVKHKLKECFLVVVLDSSGPVVEEVVKPAAVERAEEALTNLIGSTAKVVEYELAEKTDQGLKVTTYKNGTLAAQRIEKPIEGASRDHEPEGEELRSITVSHAAGVKMATGGYRNRIEGTISTMMPGRWRTQWDLEHDLARFEQRPSLPGSIWLPTDMPENVDDLLANYDDVAILKAIDEDGNKLYWYPARVPQMLMSGGTGSGKTSTTHAIVGKITQYGWPVWIADGKGIEFLNHITWPNVQVVATSIEQQVAVVYRAYKLAKHRYDLVKSGDARIEDFEPLMVVLDEWSEMIQELTGWYEEIKQKGDKPRPPLMRWYTSLLRLARTARVHLIVTMQRPDVALFGDGGGEARSNMGERISVGRLDPHGAEMMWNSRALGVTIPNSARQRAVTTNGAGRPVEAQCYRFPSMTAPEDSEQGQLRQALMPKEARHPRLLILPPEERGDGEPLRFRDYAETEWVLAEARPDLDPVARAANRKGKIDGRRASSALVMLGLQSAHDDADDHAAARAGQLAENAGNYSLDDELPWDTDEANNWGSDDPYADYDDAIPTPPAHLEIGDLIEVDDQWVFVNEAPEDDPVAPGSLAIYYRGEGDEYGAVSLPDDSPVLTRRASTPPGEDHA